MIFTYLLKSKQNNSFYTGISENPEKRLLEHNSGKLKTTSKGKLWRLVFIKEHDSYSNARKHEKWLKKKSKKYKEWLAQPAPPGLGGVK